MSGYIQRKSNFHAKVCSDCGVNFKGTWGFSGGRSGDEMSQILRLGSLNFGVLSLHLLGCIQIDGDNALICIASDTFAHRFFDDMMFERRINFQPGNSKLFRNPACDQAFIEDLMSHTKDFIGNEKMQMRPMRLFAKIDIGSPHRGTHEIALLVFLMLLGGRDKKFGELRMIEESIVKMLMDFLERRSTADFFK